MNIWTWLATAALVFGKMILTVYSGTAGVSMVADTRNMHGILQWWAEMYNESHLTFAIVTMLIIPILGCVLGWLADIVMNHIGIDLTHRDLAED